MARPSGSLRAPDRFPQLAKRAKQRTGHRVVVTERRRQLIRARPLHGGGRVVRRAEVAAWSGLPLRPGFQFHSIALPQERPGGKVDRAGAAPGQPLPA